jgi:hypothetical protein
MGRCAAGICYVGEQVNPLVAFSRMTTVPDAAMIPDKPMAGVVCAIPGPEVFGEERPEREAAPVALEAPEVTEPIVVEEQADTDPMPADLDEQTTEPAQADEESDAPERMPLADEDVDNPPFMPYADDSAADTAPQDMPTCDCLLDLIEWLLCGSEDSPSEEKAVIENLKYLDAVEQYPQYPSVPATEPEANVTPQSAPMDQPGDVPAGEATKPEEGPNKGDEPLQPTGGVSQGNNLQEDPHYHHQYPSCPYTGHCPYPYHVPVVTPVTSPRPAKPKKKPEHVTHKPVKKTVFILNGLEYTIHPDIDTMECRPSDIHGEMDNDGPY